MLRLGMLVCGVVLGWSAGALAQEQEARTASVKADPAPVGIVTGHVTCGDTQRAARFADVYLLPKRTPGPVPASAEAAFAAMQKEPPTVEMLQGKTRLDGSFSLGNVPVGDYYVIAHMRGYALPVVATDEPEPKWYQREVDLSKPLKNFPVTRVAADRMSEVNVTMRRGGVIGGRVLFDDGSPVSNVFVLVRLAEGKDPRTQHLGRVFDSIDQEDTRVMTDDDGRYRAAGLMPGKYTVYAQISTAQEERTISNKGRWGVSGATGFKREEMEVYAPGVFRKTEAKPLELRGDERLTDADITVKLGGLHAVEGRVLGGDDRHAISRASLVLSDDSGFRRYVLADESTGSYRFDYVPEGTYTLKVDRAEDVRLNDDMEGWKTLAQYGTASVKVIVGTQDVTAEEMVLVAKAKKENNAEE